MQYTPQGINAAGHDEQSGEPFGEVAQHGQVNAFLATNNLAERTNQKGYTWIKVSRCTHRRYDEPNDNKPCGSVVMNPTKSCMVRSPFQDRGCGHSFDLYTGRRGMNSRVASLSRSNANVHATMNLRLERSAGSWRSYPSPQQTSRAHSRTTLKPSAPSGILSTSRFANDPSL